MEDLVFVMEDLIPKRRIKRLRHPEKRDGRASLVVKPGESAIEQSLPMLRQRGVFSDAAAKRFVSGHGFSRAVTAEISDGL